MLVKCEHCGKEINRKPHFVKRSVHNFCSKECAYASPLRSEAIRRKTIERRKVPVINLSPVDLGYLAGIIDGEGSLNISPGVRSKNTSLVVAMTDKPTILHLLSLTGVGSINKSPYSSGRTNALWRWGIYSKVDLCVILPMLIPALITKKKQAELLLEFCKRRIDAIPYSEYDDQLDAAIKLANHVIYPD